jgi:arabinofuranosyltransferase
VRFRFSFRNETAAAADARETAYGRHRITWKWWAVALTLSLLVAVGWNLFRFLTDDAFISFRYVSNHMAGRGYTWNPPPFRPVEGYTNFLWIVVLELVWRVFHVAPPESANFISLLFSYGTLCIGTLLGFRMSLGGAACRDRCVLLTIALLGTVANRTFLAWTSSGLETAMFDFLFMVWIGSMLCMHRKKRVWIFSITSAAGLVYLTRPDGILPVFATALVIVAALGRRTIRGGDLLYAAPVLITPIHLIWRKAYYHAWLPNTYYAKSEGFWPQAGLRYGLSFLLEYSFWMWLFLAVLWTVKAGFRGRGRNDGAKSLSDAEVSVPLLAVLGVILTQVGFYTLVIGGDHFEYRIFSHLILLLFLSGVWLVDGVFKTRRAAVSFMILFCCLSLPIPWVHWVASSVSPAGGEESVPTHPVAGYFPRPLRGYVGLFDGLQGWLIERMICWRHGDHRNYYRIQTGAYPSRAEGEQISWEEHPVLVEGGVGIPGWVLPNIAVIDSLGLNDHVIARNPKERNGLRWMAHNRCAPQGYFDGVRPDVKVVRHHRKFVRITVHPRAEPLTSADIVEWEKKWWDRIDKKRAGK